MDVRPHLPLAPRDLLVMAALIEGPLHGYGIIKSVETQSDAGVLLDPANLYRVLARMRDAGWIEETAPPAEGDERRRTYALSRLGRDVVRAELERLKQLVAYALPSLAEGDVS